MKDVKVDYPKDIKYLLERYFSFFDCLQYNLNLVSDIEYYEQVMSCICLSEVKMVIDESEKVKRI